MEIIGVKKHIKLNNAYSTPIFNVDIINAPDTPHGMIG
jgi:hypothetical protein